MKPKLLIVEDNHLAQTVLTAIFEGLGFEVIKIMDGSAVIPYLTHNPVTLLILDLELPGMTGDEIYRIMQENPELKKIPVIPFSAHAGKLESMDGPDKIVHKIPSVINMIDKSKPTEDVNHELIKRVAACLKKKEIPLTSEMENYFKEMGT